MKKTNSLVTLGALCATMAILMTAAPASAAITTPKDSADFTYQYNGDTTPIGAPGNLSGFGNTKYLGTSILAASFTSNGSILNISPTAASPAYNIAPHASLGSPSWLDVIDDTTGHTWEISVRLKTQAELSADCGCTSIGFGAGGNRFFMGVGDGTNGVSGQLDDNGTSSSLNLTGMTNLPPATDAQHIYRFAQEPNSNVTEVWRDGVHLGTAVGTETLNRWGDFTGFTTGSEIDYVRYEVGGFAPVPEPATASLLLLGSVTLWGLRRRR